ncbi:hypothetical protein, partial [Faecalitalea cylindroides]|uniref:hypothetical protein n=1 Tax=Faecalitalea cylindroides TaxID=39483 RepID=UPI00195869EC
EVKHFIGENSWACPCEDSLPPGPFFLYRFFDTFLFIESTYKKLFCFFNGECVKIIRVSEV